LRSSLVAGLTLGPTDPVRHRSETLGATHARAKTVVLKLSKASKKMLAAKRSLKVRITITLTSAGHRRTVLHRTTTLHRKG
jgi:hypothetical protein